MKVLFVCSGNTCRSPLAEALARRIAGERGMSDISFTSAGTGAIEGGGASEGAILVGLERRVDLSAHRTRPLTPQLVNAADLVLVMSPHHLDVVRAYGERDNVHLLDHFASGGATAEPINDPFGGSLDEYRETASELEQRIRAALDWLAQ